MKYIDAHAHVNFSAFDEDRENIIKNTLENEVWMINVGTKAKTSKEAVDIAEKYYEGVYAIIGLHPIHTSKSFHDKDELGDEAEPFNSSGDVWDEDFFQELAKSIKVVGVGECGLDFFHTNVDDKEHREKQSEAFNCQIEFAVKNDLPLMIHCRDAYKETLDILKSHQKRFGTKVRGNFHFYAGGIDVAKEILDIGFTLSFTGVITFARDYRELVQYTPLDRMLSETDCPYVTPIPFRGQRNEPINVREVVKKIAEIKGLDIEVVREQILGNIRSQFRI